ncbi:30S ribosomal protein S4e [Halobacteriales archaeon QS_1_69_70]|nr:MAG: 30S ribosomal protein S4e [Halobacteriales archaeon QS_1_69_70]
MSNHQKRLAVPDSWPVERKEATYTTKAGAGPHGEGGVPLLIVLRDVLGYVDSTKEARFALGQDSVLVNGRAVSDERRPIGMFDILTFRERGEHYRVFPDEGGRLSLTSIGADAAGSKLGKIEGKRQVPGGDTQLTLHDGQTLLVEDADQYGTNDSIVVSNDDDEVVAHFPYEEGALVTAVRGAHAGRIGTIDDIQVTPGSSANNVRIEDFHGDDDFETIEAYVVIIDENFVEGADADADEPTESEVEEEPDEESEADEDTEVVDETEAEEADDEADDASESDAEADEESAEVDDASESEAEAGEEPAEVDDEADDDEETEAADEASTVAEADDESDVGDASDADAEETESEEASEAAAEGADAESDDAEADAADAAGADDGGDDQ